MPQSRQLLNKGGNHEKQHNSFCNCSSTRYWFFAIHKYTPPAAVSKEKIVGLDNDLFSSFELKQTENSQNNEKQAEDTNSSSISPLLPLWDFKGAEILRAQDTDSELEKSILDKYAIRFQSLRELANERLNILAGKALQEYKEDKAAGKLNKVLFADKYMTAMSYIQEKLDEAFNSELGNMEAELKKSGFSTQVVEHIRTEYKSSKEKFQQNIMTQKDGVAF